MKFSRKLAAATCLAAMTISATAARAVTAALTAGGGEAPYVEQQGRAVLVLMNVPQAQKPAVRAAFDAFVAELPASTPHGD